MPVLDDSVSRSKVLQFEKNLSALDCQDVLKKICKLHLPDPKESFGGKHVVDQMVHGSMGAYVRKLLVKEGFGE